MSLSDMKNILFLGGLGCGGAENQMSVVATLLAQTNNVYFIYTGDDEYCSAILRTSQVKLIKLAIPKIYTFFKITRIYILFKILTFVHKEKINTIISFLDIWNFIACAVAAIYRNDIKSVIGIRNARSDIYTTINGRLNTSLNKYAYAIVSNSYNGIDVYKKYKSPSNTRFETIYNIIKPLSVSSVYTARNKGKLSICIPASYREVKNPYRLIEAINNLTDLEKNILQVSWYGRISSDNIEVYSRMQDLVNSYYLQDCFKIYDANENIADVMLISDFVGLFSTSEGLPNSICEAMSLGKPVVMSMVSDYGILVDDGITGYVCDPYDVNDISNVLRKCISLSNDEILDMGRKAKNKAEMLFSDSVILEKWQNLI